MRKDDLNVHVFQNRILNIHSICNYSNHLFSVSYGCILSFMSDLTQPSFTCSKLTIETLEQGVKYVQ